MEPDTQRIDDAVLALLLLGLHEVDPVWKSLDWDALGRHHALGHISKPVGSAKSMVVTPQGKNKAQMLLLSMFGKQR
jgi:Domain of unknown function (DUF6429)